MANRNGVPTEDRVSEQRGNNEPISRRRLLQLAGVGVAGATVATATGNAQKTNDLEIVASGKSVDYSFTATGSIEPSYDNGFASSESDEESVKTNDDGTVTATGRVKKKYADSFSFTGDIVSFTPTDGNYRLYLNGKKIAREDLVVERRHRLEITTPPDGSVEYKLTTTGEIIKDLDNGDLSAEKDNDVITQNDDGTWTVTGLTGNGYGDTFEFKGDAVEFTPAEGDFTLFLDGTEVTTYELTGTQPPEEREHTYSFEGTGDSWADYYLEVEDNGDMIESTVDGAVIEPDFHWISDDGTKAAGRVDPGERHAYAFDNLVLDVTIDGTADAYVDGSPSDLSWYPQPGATGDGWKGGFPWQNEEETTADGPAVGGGSKYGNTVTESDADVVARSGSKLSSALSDASAGDIVFVPGGEKIDLGYGGFSVPDGVTVASDRGVNSSSGAYLYTDDEADECFTLYGSARLTGIQLAGPHPGDDWGGSSSAKAVEVRGDSEVDNCEIWGFSYGGVSVDAGDGAHVHHNIIREINKSGLGYGVTVTSGTPIIEYNYFNYNRHSVATDGQNPGYVLRHNHFGPTEVMHNIDMHDPAGDRYEVHNNIVETIRREWDDNLNHAVDVRGVPDDVAAMRDNWFFNDNAPDPNGSPDVGGQTIVQENVSDWTNVDFWDNYYGEDANVSYSDIIPGYDGSRTP